MPPLTQFVAVAPKLVYRFPSKLAPNNNMSKNIYLFDLRIVFNCFTSRRDLTIFMVSSISSFTIINVIVPEPIIILWVPSSASYAAVVNPNGMKTLLVHSLSTFSISCRLVFSNDPRILPRNAAECIIVGS